MIPALLAIAVAMAYLLHETDWMRVRLLVGPMFEVGACCQWRLPDSAVTEDMRHELIQLTRNGKHTQGEFVGWMTPLCGWGYAYQYRNFRPSMSLELVTEHSRITVTGCTDIKAINEVIRVYKNPFAGLKKPVLARLAV